MRNVLAIALILCALPAVVRAAETPKIRQLPVGTVVCTAERDIIMFMTTAKRGITCIQLGTPSSYAVLSRTSAAYEQVKLTGGDHSGVVGWTPILVSTQRPPS